MELMKGSISRLCLIWLRVTLEPFSKRKWKRKQGPAYELMVFERSHVLTFDENVFGFF